MGVRFSRQGGQDQGLGTEVAFFHYNKMRIGYLLNTTVFSVNHWVTQYTSFSGWSHTSIKGEGHLHEAEDQR